MNHTNPARTVPPGRVKLYGAGLVVIGVIGGIILGFINARMDYSWLNLIPAIVTIGIGVRHLTKAEPPKTHTVAPTPTPQQRTDHIADVLARARTQHDPYSGQPWEITSAAAINQHLQQCSTCSALFTRGRV